MWKETKHATDHETKCHSEYWTAVNKTKEKSVKTSMKHITEGSVKPSVNSTVRQIMKQSIEESVKQITNMKHKL